MSKSSIIMDHLIFRVSQLFFLGSTLLFMIFLFVGPLDIIDLALSDSAALLLNAFLSLGFFVQHSTMLRRSFRAWFEKFVSAYYQVAFYTVVSSLILVLVILFWRPAGDPFWNVNGPLRWVPRILYFLSIGGIAWTMSTLKEHLAAADPIVCRLRDIAQERKPFTVSGPYRWVRHPFYLSILMTIWSCPDLTADRLLLNVMWSVWIIVGAKLEERDMVFDEGQSYRQYQKMVPMLIPCSLRPAVKR